MRSLIATLCAFLSIPFGAAFAGDPETIHSQVLAIDAELRALEFEALKALRAGTLQSISDEIRAVDRQKFELELELARTNARREAVLAKTKEEDARRQVEQEVIGRKLQMLKEKRDAVQQDLSRVSKNVDAGVTPPHELTEMKLKMIALDEEQSTIEFQAPQGRSHFTDMLAEIEVELAGIDAVRRAIDARSEALGPLFEKAIEFEQKRAALLGKQAELNRQFAEASAAAEAR